MAKHPKIFETTYETYTVVRPLDEGGSGVVFQVVDSDNRPFALKCLAQDKVTFSKRKRFKNELDFCRKQSHPNVVRVIDTEFIAHP